MLVHKLQLILDEMLTIVMHGLALGQSACMYQSPKHHPLQLCTLCDVEPSTHMHLRGYFQLLTAVRPIQVSSLLCVV